MADEVAYVALVVSYVVLTLALAWFAHRADELAAELNIADAEIRVLTRKLDAERAEVARLQGIIQRDKF